MERQPFIAQEELKKFLETAQEFQVKGLQGELRGISKTEPEEQMSSSKDNDYDEEESENSVDIIDQESFLDSFENLDSSFDAKNGTMVDKSLALHTNN